MGFSDLELSVLYFLRSAIYSSVDINARIGINAITQLSNNILISHYSPNLYQNSSLLPYFTDHRKALAANFYGNTIILPKMYAITKDSALILNNLPIIKSTPTEQSIPRFNFVMGHYYTFYQNPLYQNPLYQNPSFLNPIYQNPLYTHSRPITLNPNLLPDTILKDSKVLAEILSKTATHYTKLGYNLHDVDSAIKKALNSFPKK